MRSSALLDHELHVIHTETAEPAAIALIAGALSETAARVGAEAIADFDGPSRSDFDPWLGGAVVVLAERGQTVAGGALRRYDSNTAELDWLWTRPDQRRRGLARRVLRELEAAALWRHYRRLYAVTGPGRTEARALLHSSGYRPLGARIGAPATGAANGVSHANGSTVIGSVNGVNVANGSNGSHAANRSTPANRESALPQLTYLGFVKALG